MAAHLFDLRKNSLPLQPNGNSIERGYESATTNRIAERAGMSVGSLYQYVADKDAVFEKLLERQAKRVVNGLSRFNLMLSDQYGRHCATFCD